MSRRCTMKDIRFPGKAASNAQQINITALIAKPFNAAKKKGKREG